MVITTIILLSACEQQKPIKVLVMHQYSNELTTYKEFDETIIKTFKKLGYIPDIKNFYMNLDDQTSDGYQNCLHPMSDSLRHANWKADIILAEGDRCLQRWNEPINDTIPSWKKNVLSVYGGILFNRKTNLNQKQSKNIVIIHDMIDMYRNIDLIKDITGNNTIEIELDHYSEDSIIYTKINQQLSDHPYSIFHDSKGITGYMRPSIIYNDSITIKFYSSEWKSNIHITTNDSNSLHYVPVPQYVNNLDTVYLNAWKYPILVVKKDVWGETIAMKTYKPQFTTRRELFNDGRGAYLCGYFTSYETVAQDMVKAAIETYEGKKPTTLYRIHEPNYYMDYDAMEQLGLDYNDYCNQYIIKNTPFKVEHPLIYIFSIIGNIILLIIILLIINYAIRKANRNSISSLAIMLEEEKEMNQLAIDASGNHYISKLEDIERVINNMGPNQEEVKKEIIQSLKEMGTHKYSFRIQTSMDEDNNMNWWDLRYVVDSYNKDQYTGFHIEGYLLNVNADVNYESEMQHIKRLAEESKQTEGFMWTMAHEIRTPLNAIIGFCDIIKMIGKGMDKQELETMAKEVETNNIMLEDIVYNIQNYSYIISNEMKYNMEDTFIDELIPELYNENKHIIEEKGLQFNLVSGWPDIHVVADRKILKKVIYQLINNAGKFTKEGSVAIGWQYYLDSKTVELWVEDSGRGISKEDQSIIFDMFWKKDTFIQGVGIGLTLAKEFVKAMGGELKVESEVGIGSRFYVIMRTKETIELPS